MIRLAQALYKPLMILAAFGGALYLLVTVANWHAAYAFEKHRSWCHDLREFGPQSSRPQWAAEQYALRCQDENNVMDL
jgi:hypothetical protein